MSALPERRMAVDEFLAWTEGRERKSEPCNDVARAGSLLTRIFRDAAIVMDPSGVEIRVAELHPPDRA